MDFWKLFQQHFTCAKPAKRRKHQLEKPESIFHPRNAKTQKAIIARYYMSRMWLTPLDLETKLKDEGNGTVHLLKRQRELFQLLERWGIHPQEMRVKLPSGKTVKARKLSYVDIHRINNKIMVQSWS